MQATRESKMKQTVEAVYENGVLRPLTPLKGLREHVHVRVTLDEETPSPNGADFDQLLGGWPEDELDDGFEEWVVEERKKNLIPDLSDD